ncbi:MAG: pentapeptide repeat-containing protein, partial [Crocosphaera sp.]|nr:pentapeptide repeat-containing protein [Crocosphaera sp.]
VVCGIIATAFAFIDIRLTNLELYIILGGITLFITVISAICTGIFWVLYEKWVIYILPILFAIIGFIEGYSRSNESQFSMIIGIIVSVVGWISGIYISKQGLQEEEKYKWVRPIILFITFLIGGTNYFKANLTDADFTSATLKNTNFNQAILTCTCFKDTVKLNLARAGNTILANPTVRDLLINPSNGSGINLFKASLRGANLESANLQEANLTQADISEASFKYANLKHTNLTEVNAVKTNFSDATLTGACVENWNIDTTTILDNVDCQYVYLLNNKKERSPSSGEFQGNEFSKLFEEVFDTVDLIFRNGIDWRAFLSAMNKVQVQNEETPLEVQSIEKKGDGVFVVKVHVPPDADKEKLHEQLVQKYEQEKKELEAEYKSKLAIKNTEIESYKRENTNLMKILEREASRPIQIIQQSHLGDGDNVGNDRTENNNL